jgi:hypothetical protein
MHSVYTGMWKKNCQILLKRVEISAFKLFRKEIWCPVITVSYSYVVSMLDGFLSVLQFPPPMFLK